VARFLDRLVDPLAEQLADDERTAADYFEFRRSIEAHASGLAARRVTEPDRAAIRACLGRMQAVHGADDPTEEADCDVELHGLIYEAAHNVLLPHIMRMPGDLMRRGIRLDQHFAIRAAVMNRDSRAAERTAAEHIDFSYATSEDIRRDAMRMATSLRRIERHDLVADIAPASRRS
jgi:GntR family transcriptional repressor for pyruvate dehydrogenase complex